MAAPETRPGLRREVRTWSWLAVICFVSYGYFHMPAAWNENSRFNLTRSIVERGRLDIDPYHDNTGDKALHEGHYYSDKAPGSSFLAVPAYWVFYNARAWTGQSLPQQRTGETPSDPIEVNQAFRAGMFISSLFSVALVSVLGMLAFAVLARRLALDQRALKLAVVALAFGSLAFPYSTVFYGHQIAGSLLFIGFALLFDQKWREAWSPRRTALAGLAASYAVATEYPSAIPAAMLLGYAAVSAPDRRLVAWFIAGCVPAAALVCIYNTICFGAPWSTGYGHVADPEFAAGMSQGFMGLTYPRPTVLFEILFGSYRGLAILCPVVLLGAVGLWRLRRSHHREALLCMLIVGYYLLLTSSYYMWWGGASLGPRHAIPMLPFLVLGLALFPRGRPRMAAWGVLAYSVLIMLVAAAVGPEPPEREPFVLSFYWEHITNNRVAVNSGSSNFGLEVGLDGLTSLLPLLAMWGWAAWRLFGRSEDADS